MAVVLLCNDPYCGSKNAVQASFERFSALTSSLPLKIAVANYPHTAALKEGRIPIRGVDAEFVNVQPQIAAFRRMVRNVEFDVCELAPTTYIIARSFGASFVALPIFLMRSFHHGALLIRPDAGIKGPKDLEGKKVGVRAYSVTTGVWARGILIDEFGLDSSKVTWVVDDEEHVTQLKLPLNVVHAPEGRSLAKMMRDGELQAGFAANAGIGREGAPTAGWDKGTAATAPDYPNLFSNAAELEAEWYRRTKIFPMHGTLVVKDSVLAENPWVAESLFEAFTQAKEEWLARVRSGEADSRADRKVTKACPIVGPDPLPHGMEQNLPTIRALESYAWKQALISRRMSLEELFVDPVVGVKRDQLNLVGSK
jgi:4,5-dihydroxyphthalate decarboxylase